MKGVSLKFLGLMAGLVLPLYALAGPVLAQQAPENEVTSLEDRRASLEDSLRASGEAIQALNEASCPVVTYADVLTAPDDVALNVCFARNQIANGDVRGAVSTLERVLLIAPQAINVRFLYGIVLFRLDSLDEAEEQFQQVARAENLPEDVRQQLAGFQDEINRRRQAWKQTVTISTGLNYDTNRNSAARSEEQLAVGARGPIALQADRPNDAGGLLGVFSYDAVYDPGLSDPHELFVGADLFFEFLNEQNQLNSQGITVDAGYRFRYPWVTFTPRLFLKNMRLENSKFYQSEGIELRAEHPVRNIPYLDSASLFYSVSVEDEDFYNTPSFQTLTLRSGQRAVGQLGGSTRLSADHAISLTGTWEHKSAAADPNNSNAATFAYKNHRLDATHTWILGDGAYLLTNLGMGVKIYQVPDPLVVGAGGPHRTERPFHARVTYGVPLSQTVVQDWLDLEDAGLAAVLENVNVAFSVQHTKQFSNITNYEYKSTKLSALLTRRFDF